jgi:hypothetical protein
MGTVFVIDRERNRKRRGDRIDRRDEIGVMKECWKNFWSLWGWFTDFGR